MTYYILSEIRKEFEGPDKFSILEISENKAALSDLANQYQYEYDCFVDKVRRGQEIKNNIHYTVRKECPHPMLLEQEKIVGSLTKDQQRIRSKIGMQNAKLLQDLEKEETKIFSREVQIVDENIGLLLRLGDVLDKLSENDKDCFINYANSDLIWHDCKYVVEEFCNKNPIYATV